MSSAERRARARRGFTLIELMVVISIIGILAAILLPVMIRARFRAYHSGCVQNERNIASALELYAIESHSLYPTDLNTLTNGSRPFIAHLGNCPSNGATYDTTYTTSDANQSYLLTCPGIHESQMGGAVVDGYPQAMNGMIFTHRPPAP